MSSIPTGEEALFADALARPPAQRVTFLAQACGTDAELLARLVGLLAAHDGTKSLLAPAPTPREAAHAEESAGDSIGHYKLLQKIGEGGCGVVWMAEQEEPVRRRVALKVIKLGMDTKAVVARFEAERQALAMMDHPCIAKVYDAGSTDTGRPFFVMELVRGIPITKYCDENHLTPKERLELFIKVCQAIQHAHQKGVIHRDIKPSNILVTVNDGAPTPKVIDFGIAKATQGKLTDATVFTAFEQFIGTPVYMSPEQAEMSSLDIDTRSDIYSLGVLLYELLTGKPPFDPKAFAQAGVDQIRKQIREVEPARPSARLGTLDEAERTTIAQLRGTAATQLSLELRGDLDWIVMRCIEKDRTRRYDTANGLAMDIQRYLRHEPVMARPPSTRYLLRKLIRRNRVMFGGIVAVGCVLVLGAVVSTWQAIRATSAEREKTRLHRDAESARANEARLREIAVRQELRARQRAYAADMGLVRHAVAADNLGQARLLLDRHRPMSGQRDLRGWEWRYWWQFVQPDFRDVLDRRPSSISSLSLSSDGNLLAVAELEDGGLGIWDLRFRTGKRMHGGEGFVLAAFSPAGSLLAVAIETWSNGAWQREVQLRDLASNQLVTRLPLEGPCRAIGFSHDGARLITATCEPANEVVVWRIADGTKIANIPARPPLYLYGTPLAATRNFDLVAHAALGEGLRVFDVTTGKLRWENASAHERVQSLAFSPDGRVLASGGAFADTSIRLWNAADGSEIGRLDGHRSWISALLFWPDGQILASASADHTIRLWDVKEQKLRRTLRGHQRGVFQLALLPDARTLISGGEEGRICTWDVSAVDNRQAYVTLPRPIAAWRFSMDGRSIVTVDSDGSVDSWSGAALQDRSPIMNLAADGGEKSRGNFTAIRPGRWRLVHLSPTEPLVAVGSADRVVNVWDIERRMLLRKLSIPEGSVIPEKFFGRGRRLLTRDGDYATVRDWDLISGSEIASWQIPDSPAITLWKAGVALTPQEDRCLVIGWNGKAVIRDMISGHQISHDFKIKEAADPKFSADGKLLVAASGVGGANIWDAQTLQPVTSLSGFLRNVYSVAVSPDGERLAGSSNGDESVKLWDLESHEEVVLLQGAGALFRRTAFSSDGNMLGSVNDAGILHVWRAPSWSEIGDREKVNAASGGNP